MRRLRAGHFYNSIRGSTKSFPTLATADRLFHEATFHRSYPTGHRNPSSEAQKPTARKKRWNRAKSRQDFGLKELLEGSMATRRTVQLSNSIVQIALFTVIQNVDGTALTKIVSGPL